MADQGDPRLTVVLPTHNGEEHIGEQLGALEAQEWDRSWEIVFLNNDSTDGTRTILERWVDRMPVPARIVDAAEHHSLSYARNAGVAAARGRSVAFCDDDDLICPEWVAAMGQTLEDHPFVASSFEYALLNDPVTASVRGSFQTEELGSAMGVPVASGGGSGCHRHLWEAVGGNSLDFYRSGEDIDFSLRLFRKTGVEPVLCREAVYHVRLRGGIRSSFAQARRFAESAVALYAVHGDHVGAVREPTSKTIRRYLGLIARLPTIRTREGRLKWVWQLGYRLGRLEGSARERRWYP